MDFITNVVAKKFIQSVRQSSETIIFNTASEDSELFEIAQSRGIVTDDNIDLAFFKNIYALTDQANLNDCILPKAAIEQALDTIVGKPIDIDHIRSYVIGHYLGAKIVDNIIYAYGCIYKASFADEWDTVKDLFDKGELATSFEIWCPSDKREQHEDGTYSLLEPTIAGGAILIRTNPAFPEAKVLDMAKIKIQESPLPSGLVAASEELSDFIDTKEQARFYMWDNQIIESLLYNTKCPDCDGNWLLVNKVDYEAGTGELQCEDCGFKSGFDFNLKLAATEEPTLNFKTEEGKTFQEYKSNKKENKVMEEKIKELEAELASLKAELEAAQAEIVSKDTTIASLEEAKATLSEEVKSQLEAALSEADARIAKAKEDAKIVAERRSSLTEEFAADLSDEDILNDDKYEIAKLRQECAELKKAKPVKQEQAAVTGSVETKEDEIKKMRARIDKQAYGL